MLSHCLCLFCLYVVKSNSCKIKLLQERITALGKQTVITNNSKIKARISAETGTAASDARVTATLIGIAKGVYIASKETTSSPSRVAAGQGKQVRNVNRYMDRHRLCIQLFFITHRGATISNIFSVRSKNNYRVGLLCQ